MTQQVSKNEIATQDKSEIGLSSHGRTAYPPWVISLAQVLAAFLLGASSSLAFAPYQFYPLAILAPAGLLLLILPMKPSRAFAMGFTFGCGLFGAGVYWVFIVLYQFAEIPAWLSGLLTILFIMLFALFPACACYGTERYYKTQHAAKFIFAFPALWVLSEWIRSWIGSGFPWLLLGYTQINSPLKGFAPIFSVYGVSLVVLMMSGLLVNAYRSRKHLFYLYLSLLGFFTIWIMGALLNLIAWTHPSGKPLAVTLVQGDIPQSLKWSPEYLELSLERYATLSKPWWSKSNLIVWPESAIPLSLQDAAPFINMMDEEAKSHHAHLVLGIPVQNPRGEGYYNAIVTLGKNKSTYLQRHLVPFGQYIPLAPYLSHVLQLLPIPLPDMQTGHMTQKPLVAGDVKINAAVCFEIAFPELVRMRDQEIGALLTVTNDAWFGRSIAQAQHLQMAMMRALELGRPLMFASNNGTTALIGPKGTLTQAAPAYKPVVLHGKIQPMQGRTPWMAYGMDPMLILILAFLLGAKPWGWRFVWRLNPDVNPET